MPPSLRERTARRAAAFADRPDAVALLVAALVLLAGAQVALVFAVPSWANDEPAHVGYVASLAAGDLPDIETDIVDDPSRFAGGGAELRGWDEAHGDVWTANHPPLFHLAMVPVWWALHDVDLSWMILTMRLANTVGFAVWVYLVGALARTLVPGRPAVSSLAVVVAATPTLVMRSGFFQNDGWASAAAVLLLLATVRMLRGGVTGRWVAVAVAAGTVAAGTRAQGALAVALCSVALLVVLVRRGDGWRAVGVAGVVGGVPALAFGWFYVRNLVLYGDLTGQAALLRKFDRDPVTSWSQVPGISGLAEPVQATALVLVVAALLVPVAVVGSWRRHGLRVDAAWTLLAVHALVTVQSLVGFIREGGGFHDRYLMQAMPLLATVVAVGMLELGRRVPRVPGSPAAERRDWARATGWSVVLLVWLGGALAWLQHRHVYSRQDGSPVDGPVPDLLAGLAVLAGLGVLAVLVRRRRQRSAVGAWLPRTASTDSAATSCHRREPASM